MKSFIKRINLKLFRKTMGQPIAVAEDKTIKISGHYKIKDTYKGFLDYLETLHYDPTVKEYAEKNTDGSREIIAKIVAEKKWNDIYLSVIKFSITLEGKDEEVQIGNHKDIMTKGSGKLVVNAHLDPDYGAVREKTPLTKFLNQVYNKYIDNDEIKNWAKTAAKDVEKIISKFKDHMNSTIK